MYYITEFGIETPFHPYFILTLHNLPKPRVACPALHVTARHVVVSKFCTVDCSRNMFYFIICLKHFIKYISTVYFIYKEIKIETFKHFWFFAYVNRQSAALSSVTQHAIPPEFGGKCSKEVLTLGFQVPFCLPC